MSHIAMQTTVRGQPIFRDVQALRRAAARLGGELVEGNVYRWYGRSVGATPLPAGMKAADLGRNAKFVIRIAEPKYSEMRTKYGQAPYEIGVVEDPNNPGCYLPVYDTYINGMGLDDVFGAPVLGPDGRVLLLAPRLKQFYDMACEELAAAAAGDVIVFLPVREARRQFPHLVPEVADEEAWVCITETEQRLGV